MGGRPPSQGWGESYTDMKHPAQIRCSVPKGSCPFVLGHFCDQWAGAGRGLCPHPQLSTQPASRPSSPPAPAPPRVQLWPRLHTALPSPVPARTVSTLQESSFYSRTKDVSLPPRRVQGPTTGGPQFRPSPALPIQTHTQPV